METKNSKLFEGMEDLGFDNVNDLDLYGSKKTNEEEAKVVKEEAKQNEENLLYNKEVTCPVCGLRFNARSVKVSAARVTKKDSDFFTRYSNVNPYFYDVWLCTSCGYAAMKKDFDYIREYQSEKIKQKITTRWRGKTYPEVYNLDIAIERYKLALLSYAASESKNSSKAMTCLKIAWMYRLKGDSVNEIIFIKQSLEGFENAYFNEDFPIYGMDRYTTMYLIGELYRRSGDNDKAMVWFSKVITTPNVTQKLKDMARDQKDIMKEEEKKAEKQSQNELEDISNPEENKRGFFKSLFKGKS